MVESNIILLASEGCYKRLLEAGLDSDPNFPNIQNPTHYLNPEAHKA